MPSKRTSAANMALGGILAAVAVVLMCMGTLIPVATYACPMLCTLLLQAVLKTCGRRVAWAWYGAVAILGLLMAPDKEAAAVFVFLGDYPILRPWFNRRKLPWIWKTVYFNTVILILYSLLLYVIGLEGEDTGLLLGAVLLFLGNAVFVLLDILLGRRFVRRR